MTGDELRAQVRIAVDERGASAVAREYGVSRGGLLSFLAGTCTPGTEALIRQHIQDPATEDGARHA